MTVLFRELQVFERGPLKFEPYGIETIESVSRNLATLSSGNWLKPTSEDSVFFFRANAVLGAGFTRRRYTVEIGDYAGERLAEFDPASEQWLHRTGYFDYAVGSDIVFFGIDGGILCDSDTAIGDEMLLRLLAALQMLIEKKGVAPGNLLLVPVGLLILKADLIKESGVPFEEVENRLKRFADVCRRRCRSFNLFFVSAIGHMEGSEGPPRDIHPDNVVEPMLWGLTHVRVSNMK